MTYYRPRNTATSDQWGSGAGSYRFLTNEQRVTRSPLGNLFILRLTRFDAKGVLCVVSPGNRSMLRDYDGTSIGYQGTKVLTPAHFHSGFTPKSERV